MTNQPANPVPVKTTTKGDLAVSPTDYCGRACVDVYLAGVRAGSSVGLWRITDQYRRSPMIVKSGMDLSPYSHLLDNKFALTPSEAQIVQDVIDQHQAVIDSYSAEPVAISYEIGCDIPDRISYKYPEGTTRDWIKPHPLIESIRGLDWRLVKSIAERHGATEIPGTHTTYGGWLLEAAAMAEVEALAAEALAREQSAREARNASLDAVEVPDIARRAYEQYRGSADRAWAEGDESGWALINQYAEAIEHQRGV